MIKKSIFIIICLLSVIMMSHTPNFKTSDQKDAFQKLQNNDSVCLNDGPYVFITKDSLIEKTIVNGGVKSKFIGLYSDSSPFSSDISIYKTNNPIVALSDIHGQFNLALIILKNNGIIDQDLNWSFGKGQLVIVGDLFDRGDKVTELLWFVYSLEKQAAEQGGKVHVLLGNHEYMVMQNDLRYINKKYTLTSQILKMPYDKLYDNTTLLGKWLRSKSTILKINDNVFVHGGISEGFLKQGFDLDQTNKLMRQSLLEEYNPVEKDTIYQKYFDSFGPVWYRGYFQETFTNKNIKSILKSLKAKHIIVGHTSQSKIESLYKNKVLAVDSSIKNGLYGELLFIENGGFYRGTMDGKKIKLK